MESRQKELAILIREMTFGDLLEFSRSLVGNIKSIQEDDARWAPDSEDRIAHLIHDWAENNVDTEDGE